MMETFFDSEGIFTSMAILENIPILWNEIDNHNFRACWRTETGDRGCCGIGMSRNTRVFIVGTRLLCYQRSHFYSYRYCCPEIEFRLLRSTCNVVWWQCEHLDEMEWSSRGLVERYTWNIGSCLYQFSVGYVFTVGYVMHRFLRSDG